MADGAVQDRVFRKLVAKLNENPRGKDALVNVCGALLSVEADNAKQAIDRLMANDFETAKTLVDELDLVVHRYVVEANCSELTKSAAPSSGASLSSIG
ncbi:MAG: hypothetical protein QXO47_10065 [Thermoproteota archaeon]